VRRIDHIVVAVRELDQAADFYRRLGFKVGPRNRHPWGTENRLIQFGSSFIELITPGSSAHLIPPHQPRQFSFGAFVRNCLEQREGIAMLVLSSADAISDAARFAAQGIGDFEPFSFERKAKKPDGSETHVAFTLAFASDPGAPHAGFFVCQQHVPENFWNKSFQQHANSASDIAAVTLASSDPKQHAEFLTKFTGAEKQCLPNNRLRFGLGGGRIEVVSTTEARMPFLASPLLTSFAARVPGTDTVMRLLSAGKIPFTTSDSEVVLAPATCLGVELRFETSPEKYS
jgi:catechol 2,3-dioxygenase-like lactoylglutathione lyase family enzyme